MATKARARKTQQRSAKAPDDRQRLEMLRMMMLIRRFEEKAAEMYARSKIRGFLHLYIGQEAVAVGAIGALRDDDYIVSHYREHGHALARGVEPGRIMAELFGKSTGVSKGKGGSMHLFDASRSFMGGYAIVGGGMPLAVGLGLANQHQKNGRIAFALFGEGAVNQGEFHEALNLAAVWKLPVLFFCENNLYSMGTAVNRVAAEPETYKRAAAYNIPASRVDGQDVLAVRDATRLAAEHVRSGKGPYFLETVTFRFRGHSMADPELYRDKKEVEEARRRRDPIALFRAKLEKAGKLSSAKWKALEREVEDIVNEAVAFAEESAEPEPGALYEDVYAE